MSNYGGGAEDKWFRAAWAATGKKLDMGKCCIRFKKLDDLPLDVIGEAIRRVPAKKYIEYFESTFRSMSKKPATTAKGKKPKPKASVAGSKKSASQSAKPIKAAKSARKKS
jgi:hypothetical protein